MHGGASPPNRREIGDILTVGFGTAVAMWAIGFLTHLPLGVAPEGGAPAWSVPAPLVFALLIIAMVIGGRWVGRKSWRGVRGGAWAGAVTGLVNLLILGSVINSLDEKNLISYAAIWGPALILISAALGAFGALLGANRAPSASARADAANRAQSASVRADLSSAAPPPNWPLAFTLVTCAATLLLIAVGGSVTGFEAGLAVPDWPGTFGYNMVLFPLAKMTGGIYFEHSHRLLGVLVGLTTLVLATYLLVVERRGWVKSLAVAAFVLVVVQGLLGAVRVRGANPGTLEPNATMGMVHGTLAHIFFVTLIVLACALSYVWRGAREPYVRPAAKRDRTIGAITLALVLAQIVLGVILRQSGAQVTWALHLHLTLAAFVIVMVIIFGLRLWGLADHVPLVARFGKLSIHTLIGQIILGFAALWAILVENPEAPPHPVQVVITTLHQTFGAVLLAMVTAAFVWHQRRVAPAAAPVLN